MEYISEIASFIAGLLGGWSLRIYVTSRSGDSTQIGNTVGGDQAGRDIHK